ncbi:MULTISPECIES: flagellar hook protein FlgE [unclassified Sphingomonas]|uniref:flagellar hook protein FlgE n=1 Tax=unclassified Sphingomonas TaxID=196159 RepID=UPI0016078196|nr:MULTISPECIES: flagellar hook protein FlgE [unclassified Sphingomonas]MBB3347607.1 flagellar hook protein FlgE [Sphingomonas sp. BK069]MBB3472404.1 flagellar hook protein FlgE [Sphingomonas sp. BK345]
MSFFTSLSGLQAMQTDMSVISHNLANVSTNGFKKSRTAFADVISSNVSTDPRKMVGSGVSVKGTVQQFSDGSSNQTKSALDMQILGEGFFVVKSTGLSDQVNYTRTGAFTVDESRNVIDAQGSYLMVYPVDNDGNVTATGDKSLTNLQIQPTSGTPKMTNNVATKVQIPSTATVKDPAAFKRTDTTTYNNSVATRIYDANGNPMTMTSYYVRTKEGEPAATPPNTGTWQVFTYVGDQMLTPQGQTSAGPITQVYDTKGALTGAQTIQFEDFIPASGAAAQGISLDLTGSTQTAAAAAVSARTQDGVAVGQLVGITVDDAGIIKASYSNSDIVPLGKVAIAKFSAPTGLRQAGSNYWQATGISGKATLGFAAAEGFGSLKSGQLEGSNVDITEELVNLIAAQRNFQANAKALDTATQVSQSILNIRA